MTPWNCIPSGLERRRYSSSLQLPQCFFVVLIQLFFADEVATFSSTLASLFSPLLPGCLGFTYSTSLHHLVFFSFIFLVFVFFSFSISPFINFCQLASVHAKKECEKMFVVNVVEALTSRQGLSEHNFVNKLKIWEMAFTGILLTSANRTCHVSRL